MAINKKLIYFKHKSNFTTALNDKQILDTSIVWIEDTKEIYTHGQYFGFPADRDTDLTTVETLADQLSQELNTEKAVRAEADSDLNSKITALEAANTQLQEDIATETSARQAAIHDEATARENADTVLDNRITALEKLQYDFGTISLYLSKNSSNEAILSPGDVISQEDYDKLIGLHDKTNNTIITGKITVNCDDPIILVDIPVTVTQEHTTFIDKLKLSGVFYNYDVPQDLLCQDCIKMTVQLNHNPMTGAIVKQITLNYFKELCFRTAEIQTIFNPTTTS